MNRVAFVELNGFSRKRRPVFVYTPALFGPRSAAVTRPSYLECVEKHLGEAWVLNAKHRDGYPHRLRAIGHLHGAVAESQAWLELHDATPHAGRKVKPSF